MAWRHDARLFQSSLTLDLACAWRLPAAARDKTARAQKPAYARHLWVTRVRRRTDSLAPPQVWVVPPAPGSFGGCCCGFAKRPLGVAARADFGKALAA